MLINGQQRLVEFSPISSSAILLGAGIAAVYLVVAVLQLAQLKRHRPPVPHPQEPSLGLQHQIGKGQIKRKSEASEDKSFALYLRRTNVEADVQRLQHEVKLLRDALSTTQEEIKSLRPQSNDSRNDSTAAPLYNEAMTLARRGFNAANIAARCGISMGEAELVSALSLTTQTHDLTTDDKKSANKEPNERQHERQQLYGFRAAA